MDARIAEGRAVADPLGGRSGPVACQRVHASRVLQPQPTEIRPRLFVVKQPIPGLLLSNCLRAGIVGLCKTLSQEFAPYGITVNNAGMVINRTAVQGSGGNGILAGPSALIHIGASSVAANSLGGFAYNGGQVLSYGDNKLKGNGIDNAPSGTLALQ